MKDWQESWGIVECCGFGLRVDVEEGLNWFGEEGVMSALRFVFILSSMRLRESRRNERSEFCEKQNCGVSLDGGSGGWPIISGRGDGEDVGSGGVSLRRSGREASSLV